MRRETVLSLPLQYGFPGLESSSHLTQNFHFFRFRELFHLQRRLRDESYGTLEEVAPRLVFERGTVKRKKRHVP